MIHRIGVISDAHGLLRPQVAELLGDCEVILHGGDINRQEILDELNRIAPVYATSYSKIPPFVIIVFLEASASQIHPLLLQIILAYLFFESAIDYSTKRAVLFDQITP